MGAEPEMSFPAGKAQLWFLMSFAAHGADGRARTDPPPLPHALQIET